MVIILSAYLNSDTTLKKIVLNFSSALPATLIGEQVNRIFFYANKIATNDLWNGYEKCL